MKLASGMAVTPTCTRFARPASCRPRSSSRTLPPFPAMAARHELCSPSAAKLAPSSVLRFVGYEIGISIAPPPPRKRAAPSARVSVYRFSNGVAEESRRPFVAVARASTPRLRA